MTTKSFIGKQMFMNILSAVVFCVGFAACSNDDFDDESYGTRSAAGQANDYSQYQPYGLNYDDFDSMDDVQILDTDTTIVAVKKSLADKLGITTFVNHPIGIWDAPSHLPYGRKAVEEELVGDTYILQVKEATVAELIGDKVARLATDLFVNMDPDAVEARSTTYDVPAYAAKYMDENGMYHPAAVLLTDPTGYEEDMIVEGQQPVISIRDNKPGEYEYITPEEFIAKNPKNLSCGGRILSLHKSFPFNHDIPVGKGSNDRVSISGSIPVDYELNYFLTFEPSVKWDWNKGFVFHVDKFETGLNGDFGIHPNATISFKKGIKLPEDKGKIKLASFKEQTFVFKVGVIPVYVTVAPSLYMVFDASTSCALQMGFKYDYSNSFTAGIRYQNDRWSTIKNYKVNQNEFSFNRPEMEFKAEAGVGIFLTAAIKLGGIAGPELGIGPRLGAEAKMTASPSGLDWSAEVNMKLQAWAGAKIDILGYTLAEWSTRFDLFGPWQILKFPKK